MTVAPAVATGQEVGDASTRAALTSYFERLTRFGFSGTVLAASGEDPVFVGAYGLADREQDRAFLPSTVVTIGSITKSFTAAAILVLAERGRLDVHDPIATHLPGVPPDKRGITVHHLLTHTSGLKRNGLEGGDFARAATRDSVLQNALGSQLLGPPGERYRYSNLGYALLAMIVENASGEGYESFVHRHLLAPARMYRTGYLRPHYEDRELAAGYRDGRRLDPVIRQPMLDDGPTWNLRGNGGLHSDAYDMYRWFLALRSRTVLSDRSVLRMTRGHARQPVPGRFYGYGLEVTETSRGTRDVSHSGGNGYFAADFHWFPDHDRMFFVAVNDASRVHIGRLSETVEAILFGEDVALPPVVASVPEEALRHSAGAYALPEGDTVRVTVRDGGLVLTAAGDEATRLVLGGAPMSADSSVRAFARRSQRIVEREFDGDFSPKFDAMGGAVPLESLERFHEYDRERWQDEFGAFSRVDVVAAAGAEEEVEVIVRARFERGAAAQIHTWREGRLANVSVIPDWGDFAYERTLHPISRTRFQSFDMGSSLRASVRIEEEDSPDGVRSMIFLGHPDRPVARRVGSVD